MTFSMKPQSNPTQSSNTTDVSPDQWDAWYNYYYGLIDGKEQKTKNKQGAVVPNRFFKKKKSVGILNFITDLGLQPQPDSSYEWKGEAGQGDVLSEAEQEHVAKYPDNYFRDVDGKRMQFKPERPTQEYAFFYDFPSLEVDWTKHPIEALHSLGKKPLRVCYNGYFKDNKRSIEGCAKNLRFAPNWKTGKISPNNPINKLAIAMGREDQFSTEYDFVELAGGACFFDVIISKNIGDKGNFYNTEIKNYSEITEMELPNGDTYTVEQQIPDCGVQFTGVLLNGMEYTQDQLDLVRHNKTLKAVLPKAVAFQPNAVKAPDFWLGCNYADSDLAKALAATDNSSDSSSNASQKPKKEEKKPSVPESKKAPAKEPEPSVDFDDDIPF